MIFDSNLLFSTSQSLITDTDTPSETVVDLTGGVAINIGIMTRFGEDLGIGDGVAKPQVVAYVGTAFTTGTAATLNMQFQGSTDSTTWTTYAETGGVAAAKLVAGAKLALDWPIVPAGQALPRYVRLNYKLPATSSFTAGTINLAGVVLQQDAQQYYGPAYSVAP